MIVQQNFDFWGNLLKRSVKKEYLELTLNPKIRWKIHK